MKRHSENLPAIAAMYEINVKTGFCAAHALRGHPGPCKNVHGHNWVVEVFYRSEKLDKQSMVIDFADVLKELKKITGLIDHTMINDVPPFDVENPTAEKIAEWIFKGLEESLYLPPSRVTVFETDNSSASYFIP